MGPIENFLWPKQEIGSTGSRHAQFRVHIEIVLGLTRDFGNPKLNTIQAYPPGKKPQEYV